MDEVRGRPIWCEEFRDTIPVLRHELVAPRRPQLRQPHTNGHALAVFAVVVAIVAAAFMVGCAL